MPITQEHSHTTSSLDTSQQECRHRGTTTRQRTATPEASNPRGQIPIPGGKEMDLQMQAYYIAEHQNTDNNAPCEEMQHALSVCRPQCTNTILRPTSKKKTPRCGIQGPEHSTQLVNTSGKNALNTESSTHLAHTEHSTTHMSNPSTQVI